ncbi:hypothetical protein CEXT_719701 [Caerostris extrusa]|uniref:Uncharacterized protein n=1 Tax=Caerostris extrusa TaxID=172846 RepID=A0AAV4W0R0_CAEEX|nr:hypothetical protein CEXT_719701 [Caerostris extrusa]
MFNFDSKKVWQTCQLDIRNGCQEFYGRAANNRREPLRHHAPGRQRILDLFFFHCFPAILLRRSSSCTLQLKPYWVFKYIIIPSAELITVSAVIATLSVTNVPRV